MQSSVSTNSRRTNLSPTRRVPHRSYGHWTRNGTENPPGLTSKQRVGTSIRTVTTVEAAAGLPLVGAGGLRHFILCL